MSNMEKECSIGIVGQGFVGSAIREGLKRYHTVHTFDINPELSACSSLEEMVKKSEYIFVCLPTPMSSTGRCITDLVESTITSIDNLCLMNGYENRVAIIKSTIPPGTTKFISEKCSTIDVIFSPEFLTEANSFDDFKNQARIILGGPRSSTARVKTMFRRAFPNIPIVKTDSSYAEMVKYFINCFLSTKVSFANEMYQLCHNIGVDYDKVVEYALYDTRIGKSHLSVPGPDGHFGYGGHCFPKDLSALVHLMESRELIPTILKAVREKNDEVREFRDWELMKGRAIIDD